MAFLPPIRKKGARHKGAIKKNPDASDAIGVSRGVASEQASRLGGRGVGGHEATAQSA